MTKKCSVRNQLPFTVVTLVANSTFSIEVNVFSTLVRLATQHCYFNLFVFTSLTTRRLIENSSLFLRIALISLHETFENFNKKDKRVLHSGNLVNLLLIDMRDTVCATQLLCNDTRKWRLMSLRGVIFTATLSVLLS